jgi:diaminopimelate decarboxylase
MARTILHDNVESKDGVLHFAGVDLTTLAKKYGTPLIIFDEDKFRSHIQEYREAMKTYFTSTSMPLFASKSFCFKELYRIVEDEDIGTDIVSSGELYTACAAGFDMSKAFFHGNNKTDADIAYAFDSHIGYFVVDGLEELDQIQKEASKRNQKQKILLRITPGIDPHTHKKISTGGVDSKFGSAIATGLAKAMVKEALNRENIILSGFHCHIGSQIFEVDPFCDAVDIMMEFIADMKKEFGYECEILNLGGGFGVRYVESDPVISYTENIKLLGQHLENKCKEFNVKKPSIRLEPGRSLVADAGLTLYEVGSFKEIKGVKNYVSIDGGMTDNPRYALYQSAYTVLPVESIDKVYDTKCTIAGRCCESGDIIQEDVMLPRLNRGEHVAVLVTGAYNYAMASNYNRVPRPAVVILHEGKDRLGIKRETYEDLISRDC